MALRVSCPFCNTSFTIAAVPASGRVSCPRCGDAFPVRDGDADAEGESPEAVPAASFEESLRARPSRPKSSSRILAYAAVAAILALAIGAGWYYFLDSGSGGDPLQSDPPAAVAPALLRGLAFVPEDSNILFALQPGPIIAYAERTDQDPRVLLRQAGIPDAVFVRLDRAGLPLEQIDHVAMGARIPDAPDLGQLRLVIALILRSPLADEAKFLESLSANRVVLEGKTRYAVEWGGFPFKLAKASPNAWVLGMSDEDLSAASEDDPGTTLPAQLVETLTQQLPQDSAAWLATAIEDWAEKPLIRALARFDFVKRDWLGSLAKGRAVAAGVSLADEPRLRISVRCRDTETAEELRDYFEQEFTDTGNRHGGEGDWATVDTPVHPADLLDTLKGLVRPAK